MGYKHLYSFFIMLICVHGFMHGGINYTPDSLNICKDPETSSPLNLNIGLPGGLIMRGSDPWKQFKIYIPTASSGEMMSPSMSGNGGVISFYYKAYKMKQSIHCRNVFTMPDVPLQENTGYSNKANTIESALPAVLRVGKPTAKSKIAGNSNNMLTDTRLRSLIPAAVQVVDGDTSINYMEAIPVLTKAVQELNALVEKQEERIASLKTQLQAKKSIANNWGQILSCSPNPTTNEIHVEYRLEKENVQYFLSVVDMTGNNVASLQCRNGSNSHTFSIGGCGKGIYHVVLTADNAVADTYRIIKN